MLALFIFARCWVLLVVGVHALIRIYIGISLAAAACAPPEQADECREYVSCQREYDEATGTGPIDTSRYEADGSCWTSPDAAATCIDECERGRAALAAPIVDEGIDAPSCAAGGAE